MTLQKSKSSFRSNKFDIHIINSKRSDFLNAINEIDSQRWLEASPIREEIYNQEKARMSVDIKNDAFSHHSINDPRETIYSNSVNFIPKDIIS